MLGQKSIGFTKSENQKRYEDICYKLNPEDDTLTIEYSDDFKYNPKIMKKAPGLINKYGEKELDKRAGLYAISVLFALYLIFLPCILFGKDFGLFLGFLLTIVVVTRLVILSEEYTDTVKYYRDSRCKKCGKDFALEEFREPKIEEISTVENYTITVTRYWKCKFCGFEDIRKGSENYTTRKGERNAVTHKNCRNCGKELAIIEYRYPDIKETTNKETTIRHYKCEYCDYREIKIKEEYIPDD